MVASAGHVTTIERIRRAICRALDTQFNSCCPLLVTACAPPGSAGKRDRSFQRKISSSEEIAYPTRYYVIR